MIYKTLSKIEETKLISNRFGCWTITAKVGPIWENIGRVFDKTQFLILGTDKATMIMANKITKINKVTLGGLNDKSVCAPAITPVITRKITWIKNIITCETPTAVAVPHAVYSNAQGRSVIQEDSVALGGFNGLNS